MSIMDGFNIWLGKFLFDCGLFAAFILALFVFFVIKSFIPASHSEIAAQKEEDEKTKLFLKVLNKEDKNV